jgi:hypothetical protein
LRKSFSLVFAGTLFVLSGFAHAQIDVAIGGSIPWTTKNPTATLAYTPPPLKGGVYPMASIVDMLTNRVGVEVEGSFRYHEGLYDGYQKFRPLFYDVNAVYRRKVSPKFTLDLLGGIGGETLIFYNQFANCSNATGACIALRDDDHFAAHLGAGLRYRVWRNFFVRPEAHYYFVPNNFEFHSDNVFRVGVSVGYTFGSNQTKTEKAAP